MSKGNLVNIEEKRNQEAATMLLLRQVSNALMTRSELFDSLGKSFGGHRDIYTALGYPKTLTYTEYYDRYLRDGIARRIITAPVNGSWRIKPTVLESDDSREDITPFEEDIQWLEKTIKMYHYLQRADILSGIGEYGVLFLGLNDRADLRLPVAKAEANYRKLLYLRPFTYDNAKIKEYEDNPRSEDYGKPRIYQLTVSFGDGSISNTHKTFDVHASRIIHIAEDCAENDVFGTPRLRPCYNRLIDFEKIVGCSGEMYWRNAIPGYNFKADPDVDLSTIDTSTWESEIEKYVHDLKRYIKLQGISVETITSAIADPKGPAEVCLMAISGSTRIPKRILVGSERGELASVQDDKNWAGRLEERRTDYIEPFILRRFIDRLIDIRVIREPAEEYSIDWGELTSTSEKEKTEVGQQKTEAIVKYASTPAAEYVLPWEMFMRLVLGLSQDEVEEAQGFREQMEKDELEEEDESLEIEEEDEEDEEK